LYVGFVLSPPVIVPADPVLAQWDGKAWSALGGGLQPLLQNLRVSTIVPAGTNLFVGGEFITPDGLATNLAVWNGTQWSPLGSGLDDLNLHFPGVAAMALMGSDLYVGGSITTAGGLPAANIAKWDGSKWSAVGTGIPGSILAMAVSGNNLFVGGHFVAGNARFIAKWDGTNWSNLGSGPGSEPGNFDTTAIVATGNTVYATGQSTPYIASWDGMAWSPLGSGLTPTPSCLSCAPRALAILGKDLYVGGQFTAAGGVPANGFAKWDGTQWTTINLGVSNPPAALAVAGTNLLYVGGPYEAAAGAPPGQYLLRANLSSVLPPSLAFALSGNNTATITWPSATNIALRQTVDLGSTNWVVPSETINDNGVNRH
jgi:hypothetical protein